MQSTTSTNNSGKRPPSKLGLLLLAAAVLMLALTVPQLQQNSRLTRQLHTLQAEQRVAAEANAAYTAAYQSTHQQLLYLQELPQQLQQLEADFAADIRALEDDIRSGASDKKIAYLTFDDGPYNRTADFLKVLKENDAPGTFFVLGKPAMKDDYLPTYAAGHSIGNHTYSHQIRQGIYLSVDHFINDITKLDSFLADMGIETQISRFPGGSATTSKKAAIAERLDELGYDWVDWNVSTHDAATGGCTAEQALENVKYTTADYEKIIVVLMHDFSAASLEALPDIIAWLRGEGFILLPLYYDSVMINKG